MRKTTIPAGQDRSPRRDDPGAVDPAWFDLGEVAQIEVTSEDAANPVEGALSLGDDRGWQAGQAGPQTIRVLFDRPVTVHRVSLLFIETEATRTQEFVLRWSTDGGRSLRDLVRQQWNFSPAGSTREAETYRFDLSGVTTLELSVVPDVAGGPARATLAEWRIA